MGEASHGAVHQTIERSTRILEFIFEARTPVRLSAVSRGVGLDRSTALRILHTLEDLRCVHKDPGTKAYVLGYMSQRLGARRPLLETNARHGDPFLRKLAAELGETVALGALEGVSVVFHRCLRGVQEYAPSVEIGAAYDAHATATGKMLLANLPSDDLAKLYSLQRLVRHTPRTIASFDTLLRELQTCWTDGYALENEERCIGVSAIAVPVVNPRGLTNMTISVMTRASAMTPAWHAHVLGRTKNVVREIYDYVIR